MKRTLLNIMLFLLPLCALSQNFRTVNDGNASSSGFGSGSTFDPFGRNQKDSLSGKEDEVKVPKEIHQWNIDPVFGTVQPIDADTAQYLFQNWQMTEGERGEYNYLGNMGAPRLSRIFMNRPTETEFSFLQPYDYFTIDTDEFIFTDTKSPYTNLSYHSSGNKIMGDDRFKAYFATNAGKKFGAGFLFDYLYGRGRYDNQSTALMNFSLFSYYRSDRYNYHLIASRYHMKMAENGGITDDNYISNPELTENNSSNFATTDIPVLFDRTWNRNEMWTGTFSHNYNLGFYRNEAKESVAKDTIQSDTATIETEFPSLAAYTAKSDSIAIDSTAEEDVVRKFVPVARITHTLDFFTNRREFISYQNYNNYYYNTFLPYDSLDRSRELTVKNTVALSLREGFSKWAFANVTAFASYEYNRYTLPDTMPGTKKEFRHNYSEHIINVGGLIESTRSEHFKFRVLGETSINKENLGEFNIEGNADYNFRIGKHQALLRGEGFIKNDNPSFFYTNYHSEHYWWDKELDNEFRTRIGGKFEVEGWGTTIKAGVENIKNYTYLANTSVNNGTRYLYRINVEQESDHIQIISATIGQKLRFGIFNFEAEATYQKSSKEDIIPLPALNAYANAYIKFKIARVLNTEIGADAYYFTEYDAPDYSPALGAFTLQNPEDRIKIGNYPVVNIYANFLLKETRFYVKLHHLNEGTGNMNAFLAPHYPLPGRVLWFGLSWNFYN